MSTIWTSNRSITHIFHILLLSIKLASKIQLIACMQSTGEGKDVHSNSMRTTAGSTRHFLRVSNFQFIFEFQIITNLITKKNVRKFSIVSICFRNGTQNSKNKGNYEKIDVLSFNLTDKSYLSLSILSL